MGDAFGVENVETGGSSSHVDALAVIRHRHGMEFIVLPVLEVPCLTEAISNRTEVRKTALCKKPRTICSLMGRRAACFLQAEAADHAGLLEDFAGVLVR